MTEQASVLPPADPGQDPAGLALTGSDPVAERGVSIRDVATAGQRVSIPDIPVSDGSATLPDIAVAKHGYGPGRGKKGIAAQQSLLPKSDPGDVVIHRWREQQPR